MKTLIKNITFISAVVGCGLLSSSCEDFLTITPTDKIVEEAFWQDKRDLDNAVVGCYKQFVGGDVLRKYVQWGELRSDNFDTTQPTGGIVDVMNVNLMPTNGQFDWLPVYRCINSCNKVLAHGPEVIANDESFSEQNWKPIEAEMVTLRALGHFLLVRTFGEIPYVTEDYNNDGQNMLIGQSTQLTVLNNIIADLERVKDQAILDYGNSVKNKGRITKKALLSLLADVYLWRASYKAGGNQPFKKIETSNLYIGSVQNGMDRTEEYGETAESDYRKCVECCDQIIALAKAEYIKEVKNSSSYAGGEVEFDLSSLLVQNVDKFGRQNTRSAYTQIFGTGNSSESIFELQVEGVTYGNDMITDFFYNIKDGKTGSIIAAQNLIEGALDKPNTIESAEKMFTGTDHRMWQFLRKPVSGDKSDGTIGKFISSAVEYSKDVQKVDQPSGVGLGQQYRSKDNVDANWIVYRMSEIYLMKAEAMSQIPGSNFDDAFALVREVFKRSNPKAYYNATSATDSLDNSTGAFNTADAMEKLVLAERQREFTCEGKRWFDLVRYAQRYGSTSKMLDLLVRKYSSNRSGVKSKFADMQTLFSPVFNTDIKNNAMLYQNGVWHLNESSSMTDKM